MSADPVDIVETLGNSWVAIESSFASGGTFVALLPVAETLEHKPEEAQIERKQLRVRPNDVVDPIRGLKSGVAKFTHYLQPLATVLADGVTVPSAGSYNGTWVLLKALMGGASIQEGSKVATGTSATAASVSSGDGAGFPAGQLAMLGSSVVRVTSRSTDAITWTPALSGTPSTNDPITGLATFYLARTNTQSLALRVANAQDANYQWLYQGGTGSLTFKLERNQLASFEVDLKFASFSGPSALSYSLTPNTDSASADPIAVINVSCTIDETGTTTRTDYPIDSCALTVNPGNKHLETLSGGTNGVRAVAKVEGLYDAGATLELTVRADRNTLTDWYTNKKHLQVLIVVQYLDANGAYRTIAVDMPRAAFKARPEFAKGDSGLVKTKLMLDGQLDQGCTGTLDNDALARAAVRVGLG